MSIFEKQRFEIWNQGQHPYKHTLSDFGFSNPALAGVSNIESALNYVIAAIYPNAKAAVANVAALPAVGNTINDYRVVNDDGDGNAAGYRWEQREGEASASWHKVYDFDWSTDSIIAAFYDVTQDLYVYQKGKQDLDGSGTIITGTFAGQSIYGGSQANQNLTLRANSGDGVGPHTGFVQTDDHFRPAADNSYDLGTSSNKWKDLFLAGTLLVGTMSIASGSITDSSGVIDFGNEDITTTGTITGDIIEVSSQLLIDDGVNQVTVVPGSYTDTTGEIDFGVSDLLTTGDLGAAVLTLTASAQTLILNPNVGGTEARITSSIGTIGFDNENLSGTGALTFASLTASSFVKGGNLQLSANTLSSQDVNGNILIVPNGTGIVDIQKAMTTIGQTVTGTLSVTGQLNADNLRLDGNTLSSTDANGNIVLAPNGTGIVSLASAFVPSADNTLDLGLSGTRFNDFFLGGSLGDGTDSISIGRVLQFRSAAFRDSAETIPAVTGDTIFWDSVLQKWLASAPDTEIDHGSVSGLLDDDHTQYALLAGRAGGQSLIGGTASGDDLVLESTSHATKGNIFLKDHTAPFTNASFSGSWSGVDLGDATHYFRDLYTKGEARGLRVENFTDATLPSSSGQNIGRLAYATDTKKVYIDDGTSFISAGVTKFQSDVSFDGVVTTKDVTVSSVMQDAREGIWQLRDNANNFELMYVKIETTSASNVRIITNVALPAGSYRLIGME
jgi:hypothetical protein